MLLDEGIISSSSCIYRCARTATDTDDVNRAVELLVIGQTGGACHVGDKSCAVLSHLVRLL